MIGTFRKTEGVKIPLRSEVQESLVSEVNDFVFDQEKVNEILEEFKLSKATNVQKEIIAEFVTILNKYTKIAHQMLMGFVYISIMSWEKQEKVEFRKIEDFSIEDREIALDTLAVKLKFLLKSILVKPEQWEQLEEAIEVSAKHYTLKWKNR